MDKKYPDFPAGTYNTSKIFLQADPVTGALEKVNLAPPAVWGTITGTLSSQTDLNSALVAKEPSISAGTTSQYWRGDKTWQTLAIAWGTITGTISSQTDLNSALSGKEPSISAGTTSQYWRGDKTWQTLPIIPSNILLADGSVPLTANWNVGPYSLETKQTAAASNSYINGILLTNTTAATAANQQYSPSIILEGQGWKTNATAASQSTKWKLTNIPSQAGSFPNTTLYFEYSINNAAYVTAFSIGNGGSSFASTLSFPGGTISGATTVNNNLQVTITGAGTSIQEGVAITQVQASTAGSPANYPRTFRMSGTAWTGAVSQAYDFRLEARGINGTNPIVSRLVLTTQIAAGGYNDRIFFTGDGLLGIGIVPTAYMAIKAGTTAFAQINLASSTAPTSPNDGDIWFDGTDMKIRISGATKTFTIT